MNSVNIIAELPGTDPRLADEVVMLGGHFDSWHTGTGATDNAAGSVVMMEAIRILKAIGARPRRTIRLALWDAEEGGHLGSSTYVQNHFGDPKTMALEARACQARRLLQSRQRHRENPRRVPAGERSRATDLRELAEAVPSLGATTLAIQQRRRHRSPATSIMSACRRSSSSRTRSTTKRARITRTWTYSSRFRQPIWSRPP